MFDFDRFEELRSRQGITKASIAKAVGRTPSIIQDWKRNKSVPSEEQLEIVASMLHTTVSYLCGESDNKKPVPTNEDGLNDTERRIIELFRLLPPDSQAVLLRRVEAAVQSLQSLDAPL